MIEQLEQQVGYIDGKLRVYEHTFREALFRHAKVFPDPEVAMEALFKAKIKRLATISELKKGKR